MSKTLSMLLNPRDHKILGDCADIHLQVIPDGFLPTFGRYFLLQLYDYLASSQKSFLIVSRVNDTTVGFICGSFGTGSLYRHFVIRKAALIGIPVLRRLFIRGTLRKIWEVVRYPAGEEKDDLPGSEILNFCVTRSSQGQGVGRSLFQALCDEYKRCGIQDIRIVTGSDQLAAQKFYEKEGARLRQKLQVHEGHVSLMYTLRIDT